MKGIVFAGLFQKKRKNFCGIPKAAWNGWWVGGKDQSEPGDLFEFAFGLRVIFRCFVSAGLGAAPGWSSWHVATRPFGDAKAPGRGIVSRTGLRFGGCCVSRCVARVCGSY